MAPAADRLAETLFRLSILGLAVACLSTQRVAAQARTDPQPVGVWRGTSTCLVRASACNDEVVVYRISATTSRDSLSVDARKIVNGKEDEMGVLGCRTSAPGQLACSIPRGTWRFTVRADSMVGELRLSDNSKFRDVKTVRSH